VAGIHTHNSMNDHLPGVYMSVDGDILPDYTGSINGPIHPSGANMAELEEFLDPQEDDSSLYKGDIPPEFAPINSVEHRLWRAQQAQAAAKRIIRTVVLPPVDERYSEAWADLGGGAHTYRQTGSLAPPVSSKPPRKPTSAEQNSSERAHIRRARRDRQR
jgi:hypothetical protein